MRDLFVHDALRAFLAAQNAYLHEKSVARSTFSLRFVATF